MAPAEAIQMKKLFRLIVLVLFLGGWAVAALSLHVVRDGQRIVVIPKERLDYHDIYVDTSKWTLDDVAKHPAVVARLIATGKADVLQHVDPKSTGDALTNALQTAIEKGPQTQPTTQPAANSKAV
jgi:hypothetical protein